MGRYRPDRLVLVVGTATEVGKTWVTCGLCRQLREAGVVVAARKPTQSYDPLEKVPTDAELLGEATGESASDVCPCEFTYPLAMAPPMAAEALGLTPPKLGELTSAISWPQTARVGLVEAAGAVRSPLSVDGDAIDLAKILRPEHVLLVGTAGLGAINAVRCAVRDLTEWPLTVFLNRYDPQVQLHVLNRTWLVDRDRLPVEVDLARLSTRMLGLLE